MNTDQPQVDLQQGSVITPVVDPFGDYSPFNDPSGQNLIFVLSNLKDRAGDDRFIAAVQMVMQIDYTHKTMTKGKMGFNNRYVEVAEDEDDQDSEEVFEYGIE